MKDFKKFGGGFGDRGRGDGGFAPRRSGAGRPSFGGPRTMHRAICSGCGQSCEVPFRPTGEKPVFCSNCFGEQRGESSSSSRFPRREAPVALRADRGLEEVKTQLASLNNKMEKLLELLGNSTQEKPLAPKAEKPVKAKVAKKVVKKVAKKK